MESEVCYPVSSVCLHYLSSHLSYSRGIFCSIQRTDTVHTGMHLTTVFFHFSLNEYICALCIYLDAARPLSVLIILYLEPCWLSLRIVLCIILVSWLSFFRSIFQFTFVERKKPLYMFCLSNAKEIIYAKCCL